MNETTIYYAAVGLAVGLALWIGISRDKRTQRAIRTFALHHGLTFQPQDLFKGICAGASGEYKGWKIFIGAVFVSRYTKGIGPPDKETQLEARLELPEGLAPNPARLAKFLHEGGGISGQSLRLFFPKTYFRALKYADIEKAISRLVEAAELTKKQQI